MTTLTSHANQLFKLSWPASLSSFSLKKKQHTFKAYEPLISELRPVEPPVLVKVMMILAANVLIMSPTRKEKKSLGVTAFDIEVLATVFDATHQQVSKGF